MPPPSRLLTFLRLTWVATTLLILGLIINGVSTRWDNLAAAADQRAFSNLGFAPEQYATYITTLDLIIILTHIVIAAIIFWRRSTERIALFVAYALVTGGVVIPLSLMYSLTANPSLTHLLARVIIFSGLVTSVLLLYRFPDGRWVPRWTLVLAIFWAIFAFTAIFMPDMSYSMTRWDSLSQLIALLIFSGTGVFAQIYRYQNVSIPAQRQQTKWAIVGLTAAALQPFAFFLSFVMFIPSSGPNLSNFAYQRIGANFFSLSILGHLLTTTLVDLALLLFPLSFAFAIMRYRLWDIDIFIRRTLIYSAITGALIFLYFAFGILFNQFLNFLTGRQQSELATVLTTLAVAAFSIPLRYRVQNFIDRRFYHRKYNAQQVLAQFSATARDETDLTKLTEHLIAITRDAMQPTHVSLWLKQPKDRPPSKTS